VGVEIRVLRESMKWMSRLAVKDAASSSTLYIDCVALLCSEDEVGAVVSSLRVASGPESKISMAGGVGITGTGDSELVKVEIWIKKRWIHVSVFIIHPSYRISRRRQMHDNQTYVP